MSSSIWFIAYTNISLGWRKTRTTLMTNVNSCCIEVLPWDLFPCGRKSTFFPYCFSKHSSVWNQLTINWNHSPCSLRWISNISLWFHGGICLKIIMSWSFKNTYSQFRALLPGLPLRVSTQCKMKLDYFPGKDSQVHFHEQPKTVGTCFPMPRRLCSLKVLHHLITPLSASHTF